MTLFNAIKNRIIKTSFNGSVITLMIGSPEGSFINKTISIAEWPAYLDDKLKHGYKEIDAETNTVTTQKHPVLEKLAAISRQIVEQNYKMAIKPSNDDIRKAKEVLSDLSFEKDLGTFNQKLFSLFSLIPRKMKNPILFTAKNEEDFKDILEREDTLLTNLETTTDVTESGDDNILFTDCTEVEKENIILHLDEATKKKFSRAFKVTNKETDKAFWRYLSDNKIYETSLLFHGSKNENWYSIIKTGLKTNPVNVAVTGKMFGNGIYFASKADKSGGYVSLKGSRWANGTESVAYMAVFEVATGKEYQTSAWLPQMTSITKESFKKDYAGYDSFHAMAGQSLRNDEVIVYDNAACRIKYLIELKA